MLKIYLTDLSAYNAGSLVGRWIEVPLDEEELSTEVQEILSKGASVVGGYNHEEWFITDYEWEDISLFDIEEYQDIYKLNEQLQLLNDLESYQLKSVSYLLGNGISNDIEDAINKLDDVVIHENQTMKDVAYNFIQEYYDIDSLPFILSSHIDYDALAHDMQIECNYTVQGSDVFEYLN